MIQETELRVGNYVELRGNIRRVDVKLMYNMQPYYSNPIVLTSEILEKCGFKKYSHKPGYSMGSDEMDEKCDEYSLGKLTIMDWGDGFIMSNSFSFDLRVELKHLHQLQNLYFALTGQELTVNL